MDNGRVDIAKPAAQLSEFQSEPAKVIGSIATAASAIIGLLVLTGTAIPEGLDAQVTIVIQTVGAAVMALAPLLSAMRIRREVVPVDKVPGAIRDEPYKPPATRSHVSP